MSDYFELVVQVSVVLLFGKILLINQFRSLFYRAIVRFMCSYVTLPLYALVSKVKTHSHCLLIFNHKPTLSPE